MPGDRSGGAGGADAVGVGMVLSSCSDRGGDDGTELLLCGSSTMMVSVERGLRLRGTSDCQQPLLLASCSLSANMLGDDGLQCLLECLPQLPISGSLE